MPSDKSSSAHSKKSRSRYHGTPWRKFARQPSKTTTSSGLPVADASGALPWIALPDFFAGSGTGLYLGGTLAVPIPKTTLSLTGSVGHQSIETETAFGTPDYLDWTGGATIGFKGLTFGAVAVGTDLSEAECFGGTDFCKARVVFSVSK